MKGSLKKRGDNWYAIVDIRDSSGNRKQKWINTKCEKKPDAEKALREILQKIDNNSFINPEKITFIEFLRDWLENIAKGKVEYTTWQGYDLMLKSHIVPYFHQSCNVKLQDLKPIHLQKYFEFKYRKDSTDGCGLSPSTLRKHYACISGALEHAVKMDLIPSNPVRKVTLPKKEKFKGNFYTAEQIEKLLEVALGTPIESAVYLAVTLGLRRAEVLGLKWKHIDLDDGTLTIQETRVKFLKDEVTKEPKNASSKRTLPLSDNLIEYLKVLKKRRKK
ncbi:MAG: site-specific integrase, partial [Clostridia bacterium]|nr:site-specific integrase [Clostridia bacterium]